MKLARLKWIGFAIFSLMLTACSQHLAQFSLPQQIDFKGESYVPASNSQIDEMQHWLYLPKNGTATPEKWQKGFLLFTDQNSQKRSLKARLALRESAFQTQPSTQAKLALVGNELRSEVIYPPIERHPDYQLEVSRGRELPCGFAQIQFSDKRSVLGKNSQKSVQSYQIALVQLAHEIAQLPWLIGCQ